MMREIDEIGRQHRAQQKEKGNHQHSAGFAKITVAKFVSEMRGKARSVGDKTFTSDETTGVYGARLKC